MSERERKIEKRERKREKERERKREKERERKRGRERDRYWVSAWVKDKDCTKEREERERV